MHLGFKKLSFIIFIKMSNNYIVFISLMYIIRILNKTILFIFFTPEDNLMTTCEKERRLMLFVHGQVTGQVQRSSRFSTFMSVRELDAKEENGDEEEEENNNIFVASDMHELYHDATEGLFCSNIIYRQREIFYVNGSLSSFKNLTFSSFVN